MMTMFGAMRMGSQAKARIIGVLLVAALALGGCSAVRLGYNQAPTLVWWWLDGYLDFPADQAPRVKAAIDEWFAWHRKTQLTDYADLLAVAQVQVLQPATPAQVCRWTDDLRARIDGALMHAVPLAAGLLDAVGPEQVEHLRKRYRKSNDDFEDDFLQPQADERLKASVKRAVDRAEMLYGKLDERQRRIVAEGVAASPFDPAAWYAERQAVQAEVLRTLERLGAAGRERADREADTAALAALAQRVLRAPPGPYRLYQQRLTEYNCRFAAELHNSTTPAQRRAAQGRLKGWEADLRALAAQPAPPGADSRVPPVGGFVPQPACAADASPATPNGAPLQPPLQPPCSRIVRWGAGSQPPSSSKALSPSASASPVAFSVSNA
jgi:hypothetical protein